MRKKILLPFLLVPLFSLSQGLGIGLKAGLNFASVRNASDINPTTRSGFHIGLFLAPPSNSLLGSRTELLYSRQGYNFNTGSATGGVYLDYLILPQFMTINITRYVQIQLGGQMALLLHAKADSTSGSSSGSTGSYAEVMNYYNKFDFALGGGVELHPVMGLLVGLRYNLGLGKIYKDVSNGQSPTFSSIDAKNDVIQLSVGWIFGNQQSRKRNKTQLNQNNQP